MKRYIKSSTYKVGDTVRYDSNWRGVNPKVGYGKIVSIEPGLAGHGDTRPGRIFKIEDEEGKTFKLDEGAILGSLDTNVGKEVDVDVADKDVYYFGHRGESDATLYDLKTYWNDSYDDDESLKDYPSFQAWLDDSIKNGYFVEADKRVKVSNADKDVYYSGHHGESDATLYDLKTYWNDYYDDIDEGLADYSSFDVWLDDSIKNGYFVLEQ